MTKSMDYNDMASTRATAMPERIDASLWGNPDGVPRSKIMTPLYICRYRGPRKGGTPSSHNYWEFTAVMDGELETLLEEGPLRMERGSILLIPKGVPHSELSKEPADTIWIGFEGDLGTARLPVPASVESMELLSDIERLWLLSRRKGGLNGNELDGALLKLYGSFCRLRREGSGGEGQPIAERAAAMFNERFRESLQMPSVAESLGVSEGHFFRVFKARFGQTPVEYLLSMRMNEAAQLLVNTEAPVSEVAELCGYKDQFYFSRLFRRRFGQSPSPYRRKAGELT